MGSEQEQENERPRHRVWLDSFGIARFPVTNRDYKRFLDATQIPPPPFWRDPMFSDENQPVVGVSWDEAAAYCQWLSEKTDAAVPFAD